MVTDTILKTKVRKAGPGKMIQNWRIEEKNVHNSRLEAPRLGFSSVPAFVNNLLARYFNGETIKRES